MSDISIVPSSYKDPAGFIFTHGEQFYRQVNHCYTKEYELLMGSGLYKALIKKGFLISHEEVAAPVQNLEGYYKILLPQQLPFISYAYEWSFDMLKDAALLTLAINELAVQFGMILKDATPYNVQFLNGKPVFIDTLSFEEYDNTLPWVAYRQFCEMFLYPLIISNYVGEDFQQLLKVYINGISAAFTASVLPWRSRLNLHVQLHVFLQKRVTKTSAIAKRDTKIIFDKQKMARLNDGLKSAVNQLNFKANASAWNNYYEETILNNEYLEDKKKLVTDYLEQLQFTSAIDIGSNDGFFSLLIAEKATMVLSVDSDSTCINRLYNLCKAEKRKQITPLLIDFVNPSPATGWAGTERPSFLQRAHADVVLALALVHHLVIGNNIPLAYVFKVVSKMGKYIITEFVPGHDEKVKLLLRSRKDIFSDYTIQNFENSLSIYFTIENRQVIKGSQRVLYLLKNITAA